MALFGKKSPTPVTGEMTILHSAVKGLVVFGEHLMREEFLALLDEYLTAMHTIALDHGGELVSPGDAECTTAIFSGSDHAPRAADTAVAMTAALHNSLHPLWRDRGLPALGIGVGINSGLLSVGSFGLYPVPYRFVVGEHANFGRRLAGLNRPLGTRILMAAATHDMLGDRCASREIDFVMVKGRHEPVRIFELRSATPPTPEQASRRRQWNEGLLAYRAQRWDAAIEIFDGLRDDFAAGVYIQRCQTLKADPPGDGWDGVWITR